MPAIRRVADDPYGWVVEPVPVADIANRERLVPAEFIRADGLYVTDAARRYLRPLIEGELRPPFVDGLPHYRRFKPGRVARRLPPYAF